MAANQNDASFQHEEGVHAPLLGCWSCGERKLCGGLSLKRKIPDCTFLCRCVTVEEKESCQNACPLNVPRFVSRKREVGGWELDVPSATARRIRPLPEFIPMLKDNAGRTIDLAEPVVGIRLAQIWNTKKGTLSVTSQSIRRRFRIALGSKILLNGVDHDEPLERFWSNPLRRQLIEAIRELRPCLVTTPNFSLFTNVPRHENFYNMKRIALSWFEFADAGIPCALHVNARTHHDYLRWADFIRHHGEIEYISFEFGSGTAGRRSQWHVRQLEALAERVARPIRLVVRGLPRGLSRLVNVYRSVSILDTKAYVATQRRQLIDWQPGQHLRHIASPSERGSALDSLFASNLATQRRRSIYALHGA